MKTKIAKVLSVLLFFELFIGILAVSETPGSKSWAGGIMPYDIQTVSAATDAVYSTDVYPRDNVELGASLIVTFNEPVSKATGYIRIDDLNSNVSFDSFSVTSSRVSINNNVVTIQPSKNFNSGRRYLVSIDAGAFRGKSGGLSNKVEWSLSTKGSAGAPYITSLSPSNGSSGAGTYPTLRITFNEAVKYGSGDITIYEERYNRLVKRIPVSSSDVSGGGTSTITINPRVTLSTGTWYYVKIDSGAFKNLSNVNFSGISSTSDWRFRADSYSGLYVTDLTPSNRSSSVPVNSDLTIRFNNEVSIYSGTIRIYKMGTSSSIIGDPIIYSNKREVTIRPETKFDHNATYYVEIPSGLFRDNYGNYYSGMYGSGEWSFTTGDPDRTPPTLSSAKMHNNNTIRLQYNKSLDSYYESSASNYTVTVNGEKRGISSVRVSGDSVYVSLSSGVAVGQVIKISYTAGGSWPIQDLYGNKAASFSNYTVTNTVDTTLPKITSGTVNGKSMTLYFSETLKSPSSYAHTQFTVKADGKTIGTSSNGTSSSSSLVITLDTSVANGEVVQIDYTPGSYPLETYNGNRVAAASELFVKNVNDNKAPVLKEATIAGNKVTLTYNKPMDSNSIPMNSHFSVLVDNAARYVNKVEFDSNKVILTLVSSVAKTQNVTVSYVPGSPRLRDWNYNNAPAFDAVKATNATDSQIATVKTAVVREDVLTLTLTKTVTATSELASNQFAVRVNNAPRQITSVSLNGATITIMLAQPVDGGQAVTLTYVPGNNPLKDSSGNAMKGFTNQSVVNQTNLPDGTPGFMTTSPRDLFIDEIFLLKPEGAAKSADRSRGGKTINRYTINKEQLQQAFEYIIENAYGADTIELAFDVPGGEGAASVAVPLETLQAVYKLDNDTVMSVRYGDTVYRLPLKNINADAIARQFNTNVSSIHLLFQIERQSSSTGGSFGISQLNAEGAKLIVEPYEYSISVLIGNTTRALNVNTEHLLRVRQNIVRDRTAMISFDALVNKYTYAPTFIIQEGTLTVMNFKGVSNNIYAAVTRNKDYSDIRNHWAAADIRQLASKFVIDGQTVSSFVPGKNITRAEFAVFIARALGLTGDRSATAKFSDVAPNTATGVYIEAATRAGIITGHTDGTFKPNDPITREQMALMMIRAMEHTGNPVTLTQNANTILQKFKDRNQISNVGADAVAKAVQSGIIQGRTVDTFVPRGNATRAEAVVMLKRMMQAIEYLE